MDDFSWGNTRIVIGEGGKRQVIMNDEERFHESMIPLKKFSGTCYCDCTSYTADAYRQSTNRRPGSVVLTTRKKVESQSLSPKLTLKDDSHRHVKALLNRSIHRTLAIITATPMP